MLKQAIKYKPVTFFLLTFILTTGFWFLAKIYSQKQSEGGIFLLLMFLGLLAPFATALWLIFTSCNKDLIQLFFNKLLNLRLIKLETIPAILLIPISTVIIAILISLLFGFSTDQFEIAGAFSFKVGAVPTLLFLFLAASLEELGWRGYAVESLSVKFNYFWATLIFSVLWALWHLPAFFIEHTYQSNILKLNPLYAVNFMLGIVPLAFIISWVCKKNGGSIAAAIFFHFMVNISQELFKVENQTKCIQSFVLLAFAFVIVRLQKEMFFNEKTG